MSRVIVTLHQHERDALVKFALDELRQPREQARYLLREMLIEQGYLQIETAVLHPPQLQGVNNDTNND